MNPLLLIAGLVALIWGAVFMVRGSLLAGVVATVLITACLGHAIWTYDLGPVPLTLDRIAFIGLLAVYGVQVRLGRAVHKPLTHAELVLGLLLLALSISTLLFGLHNKNPKEVTGLWRLIAGYGVPLGLYWMARESNMTSRTIKIVLGTFTVLGIYLSLTGIAEIAQQWWLVFPKQIANGKIGIHFGRARGPMLMSPTFGFYVAFSLFATLVAAPLWRKPWRYFLVPYVPLAMAGIYFCYTRSVWMGSFLGLTIVLALMLEGRTRRFVLGSLVATALLVAAIKMDSIVGIQREGAIGEGRDSAYQRVGLTYVSWQMFLDHPLIGVGFGRFPEEKLPYLADRTMPIYLNHLRSLSHHNTFLSLLTETGIIGLGLFLAVLGCWGYLGWQLYSSKLSPDWVRSIGILLLAVLGAYLPQLLFHELSYSSMDNALVFTIAGIASGLRVLAIRPQTAVLPARDPAVTGPGWPGLANRGMSGI